MYRKGRAKDSKKKQLLYTEERLQVAREEIAYLKAYAHLDTDTSFDEQSSSTIKSVAAQVNVIDDTHPTSAVQEETINTVAALAEKAAHSDEGAAFIVTVRPKDLAKCWGVRFHDINLPGYNIDLQAIKEELTTEGESFKKDGKRKRATEVHTSAKILTACCCALYAALLTSLFMYLFFIIPLYLCKSIKTNNFFRHIGYGQSTDSLG